MDGHPEAVAHGAVDRSAASGVWLDHFPFIWVLNNASLWFLRQIGLEAGGDSEHAHSEDELRLLVATNRSHDVGSLGRNIVLNAFDLRRRVAREVMRPRREITSFDSDATIEQCLAQAEQTRFSRYPILEHDNLDRALGFVHVKDLFAVRNRAGTARELLSVAKKLVYVPETSHLDRLLRMFLERKVHMAFVVDEYGGTVGLVTLENIIEELVGQIQDEFDHEKPLLVKKDADTWSVDGALPLHDLAALVGETMIEEGVTTVSGWVTHRQGGFPKEGDVLRVGAFHLVVEEVDGTRVAQLSLKRQEQPADNNDSAGAG